VSAEALEEGMTWYHVRARYDRRWRRNLRTCFSFYLVSGRLQNLLGEVWRSESEREGGGIKRSGGGFSFRPVYSIIRPGQ
jgi:hypothetical protein